MIVSNGDSRREQPNLHQLSNKGFVDGGTLVSYLPAESYGSSSSVSECDRNNTVLTL